MHCVVLILLIVGGLNWGVLALNGWDIGQLFGGMDALVSKIIYILVGLAALIELFSHKKMCRPCSGGTCKGCEGGKEMPAQDGMDHGKQM